MNFTYEDIRAFIMTHQSESIYTCFAFVTCCIVVALIWRYVARKRAWNRLYDEQCQPLSEEAQKNNIRCSIVILSQDYAQTLKRTLPKILTQKYSNYEVVVVDIASTDKTPDVLHEFEKEYDHLRHTFVPVTNQLIDIREFSLMLGIRAARGEWMMIIEPGYIPQSDEWLARMARHIDDNTDIILGTAEENTSNMLFRKSAYIECGDYEKLDKKGRRKVELSPQAAILREII